MKSANRVIEGLTFVALGAVFLGSTLGFLPWSAGATFFALLSLWPVLLVSVGLDIIGRSLDAQWLRLLSSLVILGAVLYGGLVLPSTDADGRQFPFFWSGTSSSGSTPFAFEEPRGSVKSGTITVIGGAGNIDIRGGERDVLVAMEGESPFDNPSLSVEKASSSAVEVIASMGEGSSFWPFSSSELNLKLSPAVRWDVTLETGAAASEADLEDVPVTDFTLKTGVSDSTVTLGKVPSGVTEVPVIVKAGVASVVLRIPDGVPARVETHSGLATVDVPDGYSRVDASDGRVYVSENWGSGKNRYSIEIQTGLGDVEVEEY